VNPNDWLTRLPSPLASAKPGEPRQWYRIEKKVRALLDELRSREPGAI